MNEGASAGGGQQGFNPAPPAVLDRRSATSLNTKIILNQDIQQQQSRPAIGSAAIQISTLQQQQLQPQQNIINYLSNENLVTQSSQRGLIRQTTQINSSVFSNSNNNQQNRANNSNLIIQTNNSINKPSYILSNPNNIDKEDSPIPCKRFKSDQTTIKNQDSNNSLKTIGVSDLSGLKRRILEYKYLRLKNIKEGYSEHVAELFFLQTGGNMMDYPVWRKKPPTPQFITFVKSYHLDGQSNQDSEHLKSHTSSHIASSSSESASSTQGTEIKIPGVGATPVAVSTTLPAAVVQLSQKGHLPGRPQGGRHGMVFGQISTPSALGSSNAPLVPGGTPLVPDITSCVVNQNDQNRSNTTTTSNAQQTSNTTNGNSQDQFSAKAKQEVYVMQRISELQREGLWTEKRLPKLQEPSRIKTHWDYLLEEMAWISQDFRCERKWKISAAKKCARMVQKYFNDKANAAQKAEKAQEMHLKRVAAFISKEIKLFWSNVEKLVEYKHQTKLEEKRKKALDQHLNFIVDQSEKFSQLLVEGMNKSTADVSAAPSINSSRISSPSRKNASDGEFKPENESSDDDEETIAKAEEEGANEDVGEEILALQKESQMEFDDFLKHLPANYLENRDKIPTTTSTDDEFEVDEDSSDNEDTIVEQEKTERGLDHKKELEELNADNEMSISELMAKYKQPDSENSSEKMDVDVDNEESSDESEESSIDSEEDLTEEDDSDDETKSEAADVDKNVGLKTLIEENEEKKRDEDDIINDAAALAESIQPRGNTLSSTNVVTPVPFLLKHTLREYQHIGLDWLVTMHDRKLNGILADEMGLGKTIQTISLLAHLACVNGNWGPHLIVVPSSVMLNWEMEFKKWCPGFKILTYYGAVKERKQKRMGWTKYNAFHVCITSYKLVVQDQQSFRRKKWKYLILDEAQNIKNFKSQRWQLLLNFQTEQRLLLTGTPLQNNLMELWSLMHFLMPNVFQSHREFKEWFSNPVSGMIEGNSEYNESIIKRLHKVLRPFLLRRLKSEVEKQMPKKYEHVVMCRLSKRQRYLYDDFMSRAKTRETLATGSLLSVINVLMQLRKVCNHPNLFEVRPTISPFQMEGISFHAPSIVYNMLDYDPFNEIDLHSLNLVLLQLEICLTAYVSHRIKKLSTPKKLIEEIDTLPELPPKCPSGKYKFHIRIRDAKIHENLINHSGVLVGTSPKMKTEGNKLIPVISIHKKKFSSNVNVNRSYEYTNAFYLKQKTETVSNISNENNETKKYDIIQNACQSFVKTDNKRNVTSKKGESSCGGNSNLVVALAQQLKTNYMSKETKQNPETIIDSEFYSLQQEQLRKERRQHRLQMLARFNQRRSEATPIYGEDLRESVNELLKRSRYIDFTTWHSRSYTNCLHAIKRLDNWSLTKIIKTYKERIEEMFSTFSNFAFFVPAVTAPTIQLHISHPNPSKINEIKLIDRSIGKRLSPELGLLHPIISAMKTQFPDPRLIQYDCGKLQTLDRLLRNLKTDGHRVLIFTQMTKMLDVLESFLNYHGHIYLRLDGTTRIDQRQILMERFNNDKRIFVFILSTRSGGVGVNLTGADTVIFYDSDWNPTMDAQAQDRCHRIGQTRDVHIYRLVSEKTIEENILKKANQKRLLGDLAIEGGNFTTAYFKSSTIHDLFQVENDDDASNRLAEVLDKDRERKQKLQDNLQALPSITSSIEEKSVLGVFESALAAAEDEQDVQAAKTCKAEAIADLAEFDETIPIEDADKQNLELSKADKEVENLVKQLTPIERYAMRFVEETGEAWTAEQLRAAEAEIEKQKLEWEANRLDALQKEEEKQSMDEDEDETLTYDRRDARNQIWISNNTMENMPMWCPPTPPQNDNDIYIDYSLGFLYEADIMAESQLPPVYVKKEYKRLRNDCGLYIEGRRPPKIRKEDNYYAPRSLFDRPSPALAKIRRDLKLQRYRGIFKPNVQIPGLKQAVTIKPLVEPEGMIEWCIYEDIAILHVLQNLQGLPLNLMLLSPGHSPNWDLVADVVNQYSRTYRSAKQCKYRFEAIIVPREEGKLQESPKKQKKVKNVAKNTIIKSGGVKSLRTSQLFISDNNASYTKLMKLKFDSIKSAYLKKAPPPKQIFGLATQKNSKHVAVLTEFGITNYDSPLNPIEIALIKAEKLKEKQRGTITLPPQPQQPQELAQQQIAQHVQQQQQSIIVQTSPQVNNAMQQTSVQQVTQIIQTTPIQGRQNTGNSSLGINQATAQVVKAIVNPSTIVGAQMHQHLSQQTTQQLQTQGTLQQAVTMSVPTTVSVVLTTPATGIQQVAQQGQIVSIQTSNASSASGIVTQTPTATLVQSLTAQTLPQVVSVSQLATVGTVLTTSATLQSNANVTALNPTTIRAQRIVAAPGTLQEVVLQQRQTSQSPTIVSMSGLNQGVTQNQLQTAQLRFSMAGAQQVSGVVAKGITVGSLQQGTKVGGNQPTQIQLYRQQALRQQLKVLQASGAQGAGTAVVQTANGQTALVNAAGTIIQGGIVSAGQTVQVQGQKVSVATVSAPNVTGNTGIVTSVATLQVAPGQGRTQFIKQVGIGGKQTITRQATDSEMLLVKRQVVGGHKTQVIPQAQIFTPATQGQQQIATLVKTSGVGGTGATVGMTPIQIKPGGQIKVTMANQNQVRQLQLQQQIAIAQQRKTGKMTQIAQVTGKSGVPTQLIVQGAKNLPGSVTVQQIQQVIRHAQPGTLTTTGQIVLGKTSVGRVIPVSVASQGNNRQTIQVVSAASAQALAAATGIRAHVTGNQNIAGTIKVSGATQVQTQQALINALQSQQNQRQNASPVRLQTSGSSLVAVTVQQPQTSANTTSSTTSNNDATNLLSQTTQSQTPKQ